MNHAPDYEGYRKEPKPKINWDTSTGTWVGIWGYDWANVIGNEVLKVSNKIEYEVWQPDYRADKIYLHVFKNGLKHVLFPATKKKYFYGLKIFEDIYSEQIIKELEKLSNTNNNTVLHLNAAYRLLHNIILKKYEKKIPLLGQFYTNPQTSFPVYKVLNPINFLFRYIINLQQIKYLKKFDKIIPSTQNGLDFIPKTVLKKFIFRNNHANIGIDFLKWKTEFTKEKARKLLNISQDKIILLSSSRLIPDKQIDKLILSLAKIKNKDFICYISGHGTKEYEKYLSDLVKKERLNKKIEFIGYITEKELIKYYKASDIFLSTSLYEAGPFSIYLALYYGLPTICTKTGIAAEFIEKEKCGIIIPGNKYSKWARIIEESLNNIKYIDISKKNSVFEFFNWGIIGKYYEYGYHEVIKSAQNHKIH